ncbi:MAG: dioxygenase [Rubrivivax sp.]
MSHALPPLFVSHGSPMTALEPGAAGAYWQRLGRQIDRVFGRPKAVLVVSAHSMARGPLLLAGARHHAVHDFGGFDPRLNALRYGAPGAPALAMQVQAHLAAAGVAAAIVDRSGLDHGIWIPMRVLWPQADVPVLPLAWSPEASPAGLLALGAALAPLAAEGVLVLGSGSVTHNLARVFARGLHGTAVDAPEIPESLEFRSWFAARAAAGDARALVHYRHEAPHAARLHPTDEHLLPWFVAAGAGGLGQAGAARGLRLHDSLTYAELGMDVYAFGPGAPGLLESA